MDNIQKNSYKLFKKYILHDDNFLISANEIKRDAIESAFNNVDQLFDEDTISLYETYLIEIRKQLLLAIMNHRKTYFTDKDDDFLFFANTAIESLEKDINVLKKISKENSIKLELITEIYIDYTLSINYKNIRKVYEITKTFDNLNFDSFKRSNVIHIINLVAELDHLNIRL